MTSKYSNGTTMKFLLQSVRLYEFCISWYLLMRWSEYIFKIRLKNSLDSSWFWFWMLPGSGCEKSDCYLVLVVNRFIKSGKNGDLVDLVHQIKVFFCLLVFLICRLRQMHRVGCINNSNLDVSNLKRAISKYDITAVMKSNNLIMK